MQTEITPYANVDVLAVNQRLPFADDLFDVAFWFDVLEHVTRSLRERAGTHSSPQTRRAALPEPAVPSDRARLPAPLFQRHARGRATVVLRLAEMRRSAIPKGGHPSTVLWQMLSVFQAGLEKPRRPAFLAMTVGEIVEGSPHYLASIFGAEFAKPVERRMAGGSQAIFTKAEGEEGNVLGICIDELPQFAPTDADGSGSLQ